MSRLRIGFLGTGWIGRHRMEAMLASGLADAVALADDAPEALAEALKLAPHANPVCSLDAMLDLGLDGVVIATPSALHAAQAIQALQGHTAVFCQKPLGRNAHEVTTILEAARQADRLLSVDFSYRETEAMKQIKRLVDAGTLGSIRAVDLVFHNAYGPDKSWFYDPKLSGGGCMMDLGVHLVDLALWTLGFPAVEAVEACLLASHGPLRQERGDVEDLGFATLHLAGGTLVRLACSWRLHAGQDAVIEASFYGTAGGASLRNRDGSFYDFSAEQFAGTKREMLAVPPDAWGGRAAVSWLNSLARSPRYDPAADNLSAVSQTLDRIYASAARDRPAN